MIDKVHGSIGIITKSHFLVHKYFIGESGENLNLLVLGRVGFRCVFGTAKGVVLLRAPMARLEWCRERGDGESEHGEEGGKMHSEQTGERNGIRVEAED